MNGETDIISEERSLAEAARDNWEKYWSQTFTTSELPLRRGFPGKIRRFLKRAGGRELSYRIVRDELGDCLPGPILEPGCGSGYVSLCMAMRGHRVVSLDTSPSALQTIHRQAEFLGLQPCLILASVFHLPFKDGAFAGCFNVGVLDHFGHHYRAQTFAEMIRVTAASGKSIVLTSDARSLIHPWAMRHALKKGRWLFGFKEAVASLKSSLTDRIDSSCREYSRGFLSQFEFLHYLFPFESRRRRFFFRIFYLLSFPFGFLNRLPGQYRITVVKKGDQSCG